MTDEEAIAAVLDRYSGKPPSVAEVSEAIAALSAAGFVVVPMEPTEDVVAAGDDAVVAGIQPEAILAKPWRSPAERCWAAMLSAAQTPPANGDGA